MNRARAFLATAIMLGGCATQVAPPPPPGPGNWLAVNAATGRLSGVADLVALAAQFPQSASVQRRLLSAAARANDAATARTALNRLGAMGYALRPEAIRSLALLIGEADVAAAEARAAPLRLQLGISVPWTPIGVQHRLVEGVAWDRRNHRMFLSSVVDRALLTMDDNRAQPVPGIDGGSLFGMAIDEPRRLLWIASGVVEQTPNPETAFRGLIAYHLDRRSVVGRYEAPVGAQSPGDVGLAPDGTAYASDSTGGAIYRLRPGSAALETLVPTGRLRSPQGIVVAPGGQWIYVADYNYGIAMVDIRTGSVSRLEAEAPMMLDGIDGLYWFEGELIAIQNGTNPMRIVRLGLDPSGSRVTRLRIVEAANPAWGEPTVGQIVGSDLNYIADPQWDRFGPGGVVKGDAPLRPNAVRGTPLSEKTTPPPRR